MNWKDLDGVVYLCPNAPGADGDKPRPRPFQPIPGRQFPEERRYHYMEHATSDPDIIARAIAMGCDVRLTPRDGAE